MACLADRIARACVHHYDRCLTKKGKPRDGVEWTPMAAVVGRYQDNSRDDLFVISMGTGSKCVGQNQMSGRDVPGDVRPEVHSWLPATSSHSARPAVCARAHSPTRTSCIHSEPQYGRIEFACGPSSVHMPGVPVHV
eukprot:scpid38913/ scgid14124/ tRNA-specific adenosine deaminase 1; tRNA-specific adenosine-37 deaminase